MRRAEVGSVLLLAGFRVREEQILDSCVSGFLMAF